MNIMKLYFGNTTTTVTTVMFLALLSYIGYSFISPSAAAILPLPWVQKARFGKEQSISTVRFRYSEKERQEK